MSDGFTSYRPEPRVADDFASIAQRMRDLQAQVADDGDHPDVAPAYHGPIVEDVAEIGRRLQILEVAKAPSEASSTDNSVNPSRLAEDRGDWWCC